MLTGFLNWFGPKSAKSPEEVRGEQAEPSVKVTEVTASLLLVQCARTHTHSLTHIRTLTVRRK